MNRELDNHLRRPRAMHPQQYGDTDEITVDAGFSLLKTLLQSALLLAFASLLSGCALFAGGPDTPQSVKDADAKLAPSWQAPLPHDGKVTDLKAWWSQFDDPLLAELIDAGQAVSANLAASRSRLEQARATSVQASAALWPKLDAQASGSRGQQDIRFPKGTSTNYGLAASWEIDLFGANNAAADAAGARYAGARAEWHVARVSMAAEIANTYISRRACEAQLVQTTIDADSRRETARLTDINAKAGFESPANAALARASAAQGNSALVQQRTQCDLFVKALVSLTAIDEPTLRGKLAANAGRVPQPREIAVDEVPAAALAQRPDLFSAAQTVVAASSEVWQLRAQRLPRITLAGNVGRARFETDQFVTQGPVWTVGPLQITLPIFDGGVRSANVDAGRARYDEAALTYASKLRGAVREVEEALLNLQSTSERSADAATAAEGYAMSFRGVEARQKNGMASIFELEDARRNKVRADTTVVDVQRERVAAWIALYRALGGGWTAADRDAPIPPQAGLVSTPQQNTP